MTTRRPLPNFMWAGALFGSGAICFALMLQVTAVKSDIADAERSIRATQEEIASLETEFQTRARQQQLAQWNEVDFGYVAPTAGQFMSGHDQLAALGAPASKGDGVVRMADASAVEAGPSGMEGVRVAVADTAAPAVMRQLVARDETRATATKPLAGPDEPVRVAALAPAPAKPGPAKLSAGERADIAARLKPEAAPRTAAQFAESFDLGGVIAEAGAPRR